MRPKVLIVDDEMLLRMLYKNAVERAGYDLLTASTADEGLAIAQAERPAVIILDIIMPGKDGLAALRELKAREDTKGIPVIIFTASTSEAHHATRQEATASGASAFVTKPIGPDQLVAEIKWQAPIAGSV
jgi:CheY-like chemotaxis protein